MSSRPAIILVILIISIVALCLAGVFAAMTGPINLNLNLTDHNDSKVNLTENLTQNSQPSDYKGSSSQSSSVQTYSDSVASPSSDQSQVQTTEDSSASQSSESSSSSPQGQTPSQSSESSSSSPQGQPQGQP